MASKIRKDDEVIVIAGKDKGVIGKVQKVFPKTSSAIVSGVNLVTKHKKRTQETPGKIVREEAAIHLSNLSHIDPKDKKPTRVGFKFLEDGKKVRYAKRSGELV
jgi:large subunit ribosomal protein L24